ncbi:MAG: transporter, partial [Segetibacter sp.]
MKKVLLFTTALSLLCLNSYSQGCIAVRNISGFGQYNFTNNSYSTSNWQLNLTGRYFKSFRDFKGSVDQKTPKQDESVNHVYALDISLSRMLKKGWSFNFSLPITANDRTSSLEHGGPNTKRHTTHSFGVGDIRFTAYKWLLSPDVKQKWNVQLGLGIKLPTGDYKYQDYFYRNDSTKVLSLVGPSILLGDGGTGIITELNTFYIVNKAVSLYGNFYYLLNPRDQNGQIFTTGRPLDPIRIKAGAVELTVPDVFSLRA